ncbi:tRNA glutamyl-Q(34) synthetase GluQRS [Palleronia sp. LCG004]|uniref:tRNA glutamyl-Q(34) synthetase GluQRS n=1 Tax=Palleronia sp. LCG004 TaxID=3079304 RepID=UPI0029437737|nr:tRNA glutamyl-Q(34) synthetase GluQRS [Palleronia sp. LCG004]WOI57559.1 tRNA glutamyl-Q(34) synthetase GluQRS [Palleronia sp. LCG004]
MVTRFAPSPTGPLHLGHAYSALTIQTLGADGRVHLRIEDVDRTRSRAHHAAQIEDDLHWIGFRWDGAIRVQSEHRAEHEAALASLSARGLTYPCSCSRREIGDAGARIGAMGLVYPGTCRGRSMEDARPGDAIRLDIGRALAVAGDLPGFTEWGPLHSGKHAVEPAYLTRDIGDPVLIRRESGDIAYDLACPHDDAALGVNHVIRGADLWPNTPLHVLIQTLMDWPVPDYFHHELVTDQTGRRLAKVDRSKAIARYRDEGMSPKDLRAMLPPLPAIPWAP